MKDLFRTADEVGMSGLPVLFSAPHVAAERRGAAWRLGPRSFTRRPGPVLGKRLPDGPPPGQLAVPSVGTWPRSRSGALTSASKRRAGCFCAGCRPGNAAEGCGHPQVRAGEWPVLAARSRRSWRGRGRSRRRGSVSYGSSDGSLALTPVRGGSAMSALSVLPGTSSVSFFRPNETMMYHDLA